MVRVDAAKGQCQTMFNFKDHFSDPARQFNEFFPASRENAKLMHKYENYYHYLMYTNSFFHYDDNSDWTYGADKLYGYPCDRQAESFIAPTPSSSQFRLSAFAKEFVLPIPKDKLLKMRTPKTAPVPPTIVDLPGTGSRPLPVRSKKCPAPSASTSPCSRDSNSLNSPPTWATEPSILPADAELLVA